MARIGFLGTGEIASAMVGTIAADGHAILVSERNAKVSAALAERFPAVNSARNETVVAESDVVFLCLLAEQARKVLPSLPFRKGQTVVSVMAGMSLADVAELSAPASEIAVAIPLPILPLGGTPLVAYPAGTALDAIFAPHATLHPCSSEQALNAHFAATGVLLPLLDQVSLTAGWLAGFTGDRASAEAYIAALLGGYCRLLASSPELDLEALRKGLSTAGGLNHTLATALAENGTPETLETALDGLRSRLGLPGRPRA